MMARVAASKMHGARNDFIVLDGRTQAIEELPVLARRLCDRHTGIGADGILLVGESPRAHASMRVINPDGSEAEMCGNGIRCVARYLDERGEGGDLQIATLAGILQTSVVERGETYRVRVDMGIPRLLDVDLHLDGTAVVDVGNPHVVLFGVGDVEIVRLGEQFQRHASFPGGVNVHTCIIEAPNEMRVRHYERGVGLTMACGTGAVACVVAGIARGISTSQVTVHVPGGDLEIEIQSDGHAWMTGPAIHVFDTTVDIRQFERV